MRKALAKRLEQAAGLTLLLLLPLAIFNYGSTRSGGRELLALLTGTAFLLCSLSLALKGTWPYCPRSLRLPLLLLPVLLLPWALQLCEATPSDAFTLEHWARVQARYPLSLVHTDAQGQLLLLGTCLGFFLLLLQFASKPDWRLALHGTLVLTGLGVALLAFTQNTLQWQSPYAHPGERASTFFCGPFYHHTSAGAYFNTVWPLALGLAWYYQGNSEGTSKPRPFLGLTFQFLTALLLAAQFAHLSRMPQVLMLFGLGYLLVLRWRQGKQNARKASPETSEKKVTPRWSFVACLLLIGVCVAAFGRLDRISARWTELFAEKVRPTYLNPPLHEWEAHLRADLFIQSHTPQGWLGDRGLSYETALEAILDRPLFGHGPANWRGAASVHSKDPFIRSFFQYLQFTHNDYLQSAVELGLPFALLWFYLLLSGPYRALRSKQFLQGATPSLTQTPALALLLVLLQALWDFPLQMPGLLLQGFALAALSFPPPEAQI